MKFTKIPTDTMKEIQLNAGILLSEFTPSTGAIVAANIIGATSGGISFEATTKYSDFGENIDNCPKNTKELKKVDSTEAKMAGTFVTVTPALARMLVGAAVVDGSDATKIVPKVDLDTTRDFKDLWWVGDYSDKNGDASGGFVAIHMTNTLSTGGFKLQTGDKEKGQFSFEFTAHYSIEAQDTVPYEIYVQSGT